MNSIKASFSLLLMLPFLLQAQRIDRKAVVERHNIIVRQFDSLSSLSLGNGKFAFTVDATGLQTFPEMYAKGVPLGTQSEWGWHSFTDTAAYRFEETVKDYLLNGRKVSYSVQIKEPERNKNAVNWFRQNPHRLQLGNIGFEIRKKDGSNARPEDLKSIYQYMNLYSGKLVSYFQVEGVPVMVTTYCSQQQDAIAVDVRSELLTRDQLSVSIRFPYPTGDWKDVGINTSHADLHRSSIVTSHAGGASLLHQLDTTRYFTDITWSAGAMLSEKGKHQFVITPPRGKDRFTASVRFRDTEKFSPVDTYAQMEAGNAEAWKKFWQSGGAVDFAGSTDPRAVELERRIILSQYQTRIQCAGNFPPQETGLTYNSWYGKPHMEMHWWHGIHFALWGRTELLEKSMGWYAKAADKARAIARRQGYEGLRWQKMTDHDGNESPSSVGAFLIWQQPHYIYFAELCYRAHPGIQTLQKYKELVFATADFMASYPYYDPAKQRYILGRGVIAAQERFRAEETYNPTYELVYWQWALEKAQQWRLRSGLPRHQKWDAVLAKLSPLPIQDKKYLFAESATDSYTNPEFRTDHPSVLGAWGMLPKTTMVDSGIMKNTFDWIWDNWAWKDTWGWDFPMTAMTATRIGMPGKAVDALLMPIQTNTYLVNGHNYQDDRLTIYLPGNGGLLAAVALMCAGYEGGNTVAPGFPQDGTWKVKWEGLKKMF